MYDTRLLYAIKRRWVSSRKLWYLIISLECFIWILVNRYLTFYELLGPVDNNGFNCPVVCPVDCGKDMMNCPGEDDGNGCIMPDTCMPIDLGCVYA